MSFKVFRGIKKRIGKVVDNNQVELPHKMQKKPAKKAGCCFQKTGNKNNESNK